MPGHLVTAEMLRNTPGYPRAPHVDVNDIVLDQAGLAHRLRPDSTDLTPLCWCCDAQVTGGDNALCEKHDAEYGRLKRNRNRKRNAKMISISRSEAVRIHDAIESLDPFLGRLTRAYNTGADLRPTVDAIMRHIKHVQQVVIENLPDPRE